MPTTLERDETFVVLDDHLIRRVVPARGQQYEHRCPKASFERVAHAVDELGEDGFTLDTLVAHEDPPFTQVAVVLAFLKERGIVETRYRRNYTGSSCAFEDTMIEYLAMDPAFKSD